MLTLVTSNRAKYEPFQRDLERLRIHLEPPPREVPERQSLSFAHALETKARDMAMEFGRPVLVDDAGLVLEAYRPFPGPLTSVVLRSLGPAGLKRLLDGVSDRAAMECHLGCFLHGGLRSWTGSVPGRIDVSRGIRDRGMPLSDLFVPDDPSATGVLTHRARALAALTADAFLLHLDLAEGSLPPAGCASSPSLQCPFCTEIDGDGPSIFSEMLGGRLASRILYADEHFVVMPPLGMFMPGGLLLLTREHIPSFACLPREQFGRLDRLLARVRAALVERWGVAPVVFEHGPAPERGKGTCCVDHAHFNIFPAPIRIEPHLSARMSLPLNSLAELGRLRHAEFGYLLVQETDGSLRAYDAEHAPGQLVRRIITAQLGIPERWHWRDFPGGDALIETFRALEGRIRM